MRNQIVQRKNDSVLSCVNVLAHESTTRSHRYLISADPVAGKATCTEQVPRDEITKQKLLLSSGLSTGYRFAVAQGDAAD